MPEQDRLPPQDLDNEQATLGAMLTTKEAALTGLQMLTVEDFYREAHRFIFGAMKGISDRQEPVELATVASELRRIDQLEEVGGGAYLLALMGEVQTPLHIAAYAKTVREKSILRGLLTWGAEVQAAANDNPADVDALLAQTVTGALKHADKGKRIVAASIGEHANQDGQALQAAIQAPYGVTPARFGIGELDSATGGLGGMYLVIVMAMQKVGKTYFALQAALSSAEEFVKANEERKHVLVFPLEEGRLSWLRLACAWKAGVNSMNLLPGRCPPGEKAEIGRKVAEAQDILSGYPIIIADNVHTTDEVVAAIQVEAHRHRLGLVVVDYLQRLSGEQERESLTQTGRQLQQVAEATQTPILVLSQMSVSYETGQPLPYGSRGPAFDASLVVALERDEDDEKRKLNSGKIKCLWARAIPEFGEIPYHVNYAEGGKHYGGTTSAPVPNSYGERLRGTHQDW